MQHNRILILDFGSQYTQLIARRVRELGVYSEIYAWDVHSDFIRNFKPQGIILSGGPESVTQLDSPRISDIVFELEIPILGICYGMQSLTTQLGGQVESSAHREFGQAMIEWQGLHPLFAGLEKNSRVWMSHGDRVVNIPNGFEVLAYSENGVIAAIASKSKPYVALQFHPEVTHTEDGLSLLKNFVISICACEATWTIENIIETTLKNIRSQIGDDQVMLALSGGVDSSVVAALLHRAIGDQLTCVFVDTGFLRLNEGDEVMQMFSADRHMHVIRVNAEEHFLKELANVADPEAKRKIIGREFITIFDREAAKLPNVKWLAQGTIYPDVIESAGSKTGKAHVIKSHHNVGGLPQNMQLKLIEPLRELFKDEVRRVGLSLGLPHSRIYRHPFPGPGLALRVLGEVKKNYLDILRKADAIFLEELRQADYYDRVSQAFAVFLPVKSVGVVGDARQYEYVLALRAVETIDFMTAHWASLPHELLQKISTRILNEVSGLSRVVYDISNKPPATIEWE